MSTTCLSTAYLAPIQYFSKLAVYDTIYLETEENYPKQTYRNRCHIASANGLQTLTVPVEKPATLKAPTRDIRISNHGNWRKLHWNAFLSAYNLSPFFEYYADDFHPFYKKNFRYLLDFNGSLQETICNLLDIHPNIIPTATYQYEVENDFRQAIDPRHSLPDTKFTPRPYYQVFREKHGFLPNLSIVDLLFNMGPEAIFYLK
jgi:hypothetical protein